MRHALDQGRRWVVLHEVLRQQETDAVRGSGMLRQNVQGKVTLALALAGDVMAEPILVACIVAGIVEPESDLFFGQLPRLEGPAGQHPRQLGDVVLRITGVDPERVQLHQLAGIVLVQAGLSCFCLAGILQCIAGPFIGRPGQVIIEIEKHCRMPRGGAEQIAKRSHRMGTDRVALVTGHQCPIQPFSGKNVEMVEPEINHHFFQLPGAVDGAQQSQRRGLLGHARDRLAPPPLALVTLVLALGAYCQEGTECHAGALAADRCRIQTLLQCPRQWH